MLIAYNNDIEYKNRWYHIQTEDNGIKDGHITTTVFFSGQTLDSRSTSYREAVEGVVNEDRINAIIKDMMIKQHQLYYAKLTEGHYDALMMQLVSQQTSQLPPQARAPGASRLEASSLPSANKPDILRASQQAAASQKGLGLRALSSLSPKNDIGAQQAAEPSVPPFSIQAASRPAPRVYQPSAVARSNAVDRARKNPPKRAYKGITWPDDDLAIDVLVVSLLEAN